MGFFQNNTLMILLGLVIILVLSLVVVTSYYQSSLSEYSEKYYTTEQRFELLISDLQSEKTKLNETMIAFRLKEEREQELSQRFEGLRDEAEATADELKITTGDLTSTKLNLAVTKSALLENVKELQAEKLNLLNTQAFLDNAKTTIKSYETEATVLDNRVDAVEDLFDQYQGDNITSASCKAVLTIIGDSFATVKTSKNRLGSIS